MNISCGGYAMRQIISFCHSIEGGTIEVSDAVNFTTVAAQHWDGLITTRYDSQAIWRSFVDASMAPPIRVRKRSAGASRGLHEKSRCAGGCGLRAGGRELQRSVSVGDSVEGEQLQRLQRHFGEKFEGACHSDFKFCFIFLRWAG
jgi:hypothetical protein